MNSLLQKENFAGKIQTIYIDPPYGIEYKSNFQPFVNKISVKDRNDDDLTQEPEMVTAYRDTWKHEIHSYLGYLRDRLILAKELLNETGSCGVQISDDNLHYVRIIMDEVFGYENFVSIISFRKTSNSTSTHISVVFDYIVWYAKNKKLLKSHKLYTKKELPINDPNYKYLELNKDERIRMTKEQRDNPLSIPPRSKIYRLAATTSQGKSKTDDSLIFDGEVFTPGQHSHWKTSLKGMKNLIAKNRIMKNGNRLSYVRYFNDFEYAELQNMWDDTSSGGFENKIYVVQTTAKVIRRFILMTSDPGDLILDPTCGSGTTAFVAEEFGRRWITCDTSRVAIALTKRRLMTATYKYYKLENPDQGIDAGFSYKKIQQITQKSISQDEEPNNVILYDCPDKDSSKARVSGPFTVEAVPSPTAKSLDLMYVNQYKESDLENNESKRQSDWRQELLKTGIVGKNRQKIKFLSVDPHPTTRWLHAKAKTNGNETKTVLISFGSAHTPLEQRQVENAIQEVRKLGEKPAMVIFAALQFDPEAAKDIDELRWPGIVILKAQINGDLFTSDLKSKQRKNESFMLIGQPDVELKKKKNDWEVKINGFDYYNTITNKVEPGDPTRIAMWMLDTDYDGRSIYPQQVFFPMLDIQSSWNRIAKTLKPYVEEYLLEKYSGIVSIPFKLGANKKIAVKIIDDRGIETLRIMEP